MPRIFTVFLISGFACLASNQKPALAAPSAAATAPAASSSATRSVPQAAKGTIGSQYVDANFDPDWKAYYASGKLDSGPNMRVQDGAGGDWGLVILAHHCSTLNSYKTQPDCTSGPGFYLYQLVVVDMSAGGKNAFFTCPDIRKPENGCTDLWREKGAYVIAAAKALN